jgi:hypothetical protein
MLKSSFSSLIPNKRITQDSMWGLPERSEQFVFFAPAPPTRIDTYCRKKPSNRRNNRGARAFEMEAPVNNSDHIIMCKIPIPDHAIGHVVGKKGRNIKLMRTMPGVGKAVLDMSQETCAVLVLKVTVSGLEEVMGYVSSKLVAAERSEDLIRKRWAAIQNAPYCETVEIPLHLSGFVVKKGNGLDYLRSCDGIAHVDVDTVADKWETAGGPRLCIWATKEDALKDALAWVNRQMKMGDALLSGKVTTWIPPSPSPPSVVIDEEEGTEGPFLSESVIGTLLL